MVAYRLPSMIATLYRADTTQLASYILAEEIISRTTAKNNSTVRSRSALRNPRSFRATSPVPTPTHFVRDEGDFEANRPDPPELNFDPAPQVIIPRLSEVVAPPPTIASGAPITPSTAGTPSGPRLLFNGIDPTRGCGGESVKFYGGMFSPMVDYYAKFGELEPTPVIYRNACLLEGEVPDRDKAGQVSVSIVTKEGVALCHDMHRFVYIDRDRKHA